MIRTKLLPVAAIALASLAFAAWHLTHRATATSESAGNDGHSGSFTIIGMSEPDWEAQVEQVLTDMGHPDVPGELERARAERDRLAGGPEE